VEQQPGLIGLDAAIMRSGYADEYDCWPPDQLRTTLDRERIERQRRHASRPIPEGFGYGGVRHLRAEAHEQLAMIRPRTLGQAGRVSGITPADLALVHLEGRGA
jgi:tRNA U34 5-carboxymethylaminomethyl modifying enzyme MnmG/GidA